MDQQGPQGFWTNMVVRRPVADANRAPTAVVSGPPDDPTETVTPAPRPPQSDSLLDYKKTGAFLLLSGVLLALVGVTFTATGWSDYQAKTNFELNQLLGPILISVGGTFTLISVCKFGIISCWPCRQWDEEVIALPATEQTSTAHSFTLSGINQPIVLHGATTMLCIPPAYNFITQEVHQSVELQPGRSVNGVHAAFPPHGAVCCVDNAAFTAGEEDCRRSR